MYLLRKKFDCGLIFLFFGFVSIICGVCGLGATVDPNISNPFESKTENFNFVVAGDFGCDNAARETISGMTTRKPELVIALGDLSYGKSPQCWLDMVSSLDNNNKLKISIGEHFDHNLELYKEYITHFKLAKPFYSFDYQNVHFLTLATGKNQIIPYNTFSEQYEFVKDDLERVHNKRNINWIIVCQFRPFYSSLSVHPGLDALQETYHPLFEKYGVDLVFQAHNHIYQCTYPLAYNQISSSAPIVIDKDPINYGNNPRGQIFLTLGTGGSESHELLAKAPFVVTQFQGHGFLNVDITDNDHKLTGSFFENGDTKILDKFSITK